MAVPTADAGRYLRIDGLGIQSERRDGDQVIALDGELEIANVAAIESELRHVEAGDCRKIVLDLRRLSFLDSTGIHVLMSAHARAAAAGRQIAVIVDEGPVKRVLRVSGVLSILPTQVAA